MKVSCSLWLSLSMVVLLVGCAGTVEQVSIKNINNPYQMKPLRQPKVLPKDSAAAASNELAADVDRKTRIFKTPKVKAGLTLAGINSEPVRTLTGDAVKLNVNDLPLPVFINKVFGDILGLSFSIAPELKNKKDLVTLRLTDELELPELFRTAKTVLADYGIAIIDEQGLLRFVTSKEAAGDSVPLIVSGRALPETPASHRPIFQLVQLKAVRNNNVRLWLAEAMASSQLKIMEDANRNAIWLNGPREQVGQALDIIKVLDQPLLKGRHSLVIEPTFLSPEDLAGSLMKVLKSEGYEVALSPPFGAIILLPLEINNTLVVFATDKSVLGHVTEWALQLDERSEQKIEKGLFFYHVQNTQAESLVSILASLGVGGAEVSAAGNATANNTKRGDTSNQLGDEGKLVVDSNLNAIIYRGKGKNWREILTVLNRLDKPAPQVLVEVLVAEVTITDNKKTGVAWAIENVDIDSLEGILNFGDLGSTTGGVSLVLDSAGETRAVLSALATNDRAVIRSSPRIMVKSGEDASIDVGTEIPIITSQNSAADTPTATINQNIQYRKTGVLLSIAPVVQGNGVVQLKIKQELSQQTESGASGIDSPSIFTRSLETTLSLNDGGSVLLGGLISTTQSNNTTKVPLLGDLPLLGKLFRSDAKTEVTTELMVLVIPYIIKDGEEAESITEAFRQGLSASY